MFTVCTVGLSAYNSPAKSYNTKFWQKVPKKVFAPTPIALKITNAIKMAQRIKKNSARMLYE